MALLQPLTQLCLGISNCCNSFGWWVSNTFNVKGSIWIDLVAWVLKHAWILSCLSYLSVVLLKIHKQNIQNPSHFISFELCWQRNANSICCVCVCVLSGIKHACLIYTLYATVFNWNAQKLRAYLGAYLAGLRSTIHALAQNVAQCDYLVGAVDVHEQTKQFRINWIRILSLCSTMCVCVCVLADISRNGESVLNLYNGHLAYSGGNRFVWFLPANPIWGELRYRYDFYRTKDNSIPRCLP